MTRKTQLAEVDRHRAVMEAAQKALLRPAWLSMMSHADLTPVLDMAAGPVMAAADPGFGWQPMLVPVVQRQLTALQVTAAGSRVEATVLQAIHTGYAQGDVQARMFLSLSAERTAGNSPLPPFDARAKIGDWWNDSLGATSRRVAGDLSDFLQTADTLDRDELLRVAEAALDDSVDAEFYLDEAISWSLSSGAMDRYTSSGVSQVEFLTAEDARVDEPCSDAEAGNPWPLGAAPVPPLHPACRCAVAPV